jgi:hypothetical protein
MNTNDCPFKPHPLESDFTRLKSHREWILGMLVSLCLLGNSLPAQPAPPEVLLAATNGLPAFLASLPAGTKAPYGFASDSDLAQARLGVPLQVHTITPTALANESTNSTLTALLSQTTLWYFPVMAGEETKAILVVDRMAGGWEAVSLGYAPLARELNQIAKQWPSAAGYHPRLIAVFPASRYYFTVPEVDDRNLTPILMPGQADERASPAGADQSRYSTLAPLSQAAAQLKAGFNRVNAGPKQQATPEDRP